MGSPLLGVDIVRERINSITVAIVPLQSNLGLNTILGSLHVNRCAIYYRLVLVDELYKFTNPAVVLKRSIFSGPFVIKRNLNPGI